MQNRDARSQAGELRRREDYETALAYVRIANSNFNRLLRMGPAVAALGGRKIGGKERLQTHVAFCTNLEQKIATMAQRVRL